METDLNSRYSSPAIVLHWLIALGLLGVVAMEFYMTNMSMSPTKLKMFSWHKWAGVTIFLLVLVRLGWRIIRRPPPLPAETPAVMKLAAHGGHMALYVLMLAIPLSGWLMSSAKGFQTVWFGVLPLPNLIGRDLVLGRQLSDVHLMLNILMIVIVAGHAAAALAHQFIKKDGTLYRMLPLNSLRKTA